MTKPAISISAIVPSEALPAYAREILTAAERALADPEPDRAIHDFRKEMKRLRAFLRLVEPRFGGDAKALRKSARAAAKRIAQARDIKSMLDAVDDIKGESGLSEQILDKVRTALAPSSVSSEPQAFSNSDRAALAQEVKRWLSVIANWSFADIAAPALADALVEGYRRARKSRSQDWKEPEDDELHEFRRRIIDHRYQLELLLPLWPKTNDRIDEAQKLRDALGMHRDLSLLKSMTGKGKPLSRVRSKLAPAIATRQATPLARAAKLSAKFFKAKPAAFRTRLRKVFEGREA